MECWVEVTNNGGAVGFLPPVTADDIEPIAATMIDGLHPLWARLVVATGPDGLLGWLALVREDHRLVSHWASVKRLQTRPRHRGRGIASALLTRARDVARDELGLEQLHLTARGGRWVGMSYDGIVVSGWGAMARSSEHAGSIVQGLIDTDGASGAGDS